MWPTLKLVQNSVKEQLTGSNFWRLYYNSTDKLGYSKEDHNLVTKVSLTKQISNIYNYAVQESHNGILPTSRLPHTSVTMPKSRHTCTKLGIPSFIWIRPRKAHVNQKPPNYFPTSFLILLKMCEKECWKDFPHFQQNACSGISFQNCSLTTICKKVIDPQKWAKKLYTILVPKNWRIFSQDIEHWNTSHLSHPSK